MKVPKTVGLLLAFMIAAFVGYIEFNYDGGVTPFVDDLVSSEGPQLNKIDQEIELDIQP